MRTPGNLDELQKIYLNAREQLLKSIVDAKTGVGTKTYYNTVLKSLNETITRLAAESDSYIDTAIPDEYRKSLDETYAYFTRNNLMMKSPHAFAQLHSDAIRELSLELRYNIRGGLAQVGRQILRYLDSSRDEALRRAGLESSAEKAATGSTIVDMKKNMVDKLQKQGFMTVQYGAGSKAYQVPLDSYAMLCARSTTRESGNLARENQLTSNGYDLMKMTEHYPTCELCATLQGRVYSISGADKRFPPLSRAYESGYHNVHPNCRHVMTPWVEELEDEKTVREEIERSGAPFEDPRSKDEIELYSRQQAENRRMRQDLYQYERYRERIGEDAPKSFRAFRRLKKAGGEKWGVLEAQYRGMGYYEKAVKNEPTITLVIVDTAKEAGMEAVGLEFRIKSKESYLRKIKNNYTLDGTEYEVKDILRYTYTAEAVSYVDKTLNSIDLLARKGYNTVEVKNYWLDKNNPYNGVNTTLRTTGAQAFEVQYHTQESFEVKNGKMHTLYEKWRVLPSDSSERITLENEMAKLSRSMVPPPGVERVK